MFSLKNLSLVKEGKILIDKVSLNFEPGFIYAVIGPNGVGKTSLLKLMSGIWHPTSGSILWHGMNIHTLPRQEISKIATYVPQSAHLAYDYTVQEFVAMGRYPHEAQPNMQFVKACMAKTDVLEFRNMSIRQLSQGQRQRAYIARSLATEAMVFLLDEPTSNLDANHQANIWLLSKELAFSGKIIIMATHDLVAVDRYCHRVIHLGVPIASERL